MSDVLPFPTGPERLMRFTPTTLKDAVLIDLEKREDPRGWFARTFCEEEFAAAGLKTRFVQHNASANPKAGTLRGMHYQNAAARRGEGGALYPRRDLRRDHRPAPGLADLRQAGRASSSPPTTAACSTCPRASPTAT